MTATLLQEARDIRLSRKYDGKTGCCTGRRGRLEHIPSLTRRIIYRVTVKEIAVGAIATAAPGARQDERHRRTLCYNKA